MTDRHTHTHTDTHTDKQTQAIIRAILRIGPKMALENIKDSWEEVSASTMNAVEESVACVHNFTGFADVPLFTSQIVDLAQEAGFEEVDEEDVDDLLESHAV